MNTDNKEVKKEETSTKIRSRLFYCLRWATVLKRSVFLAWRRQYLFLGGNNGG
jgi:hypothetical protein